MKSPAKPRYATNQFTWIPIYQEFAKELANWQNRQNELISFLENLRSDGFVITPLNDKSKAGIRFPLKEIEKEAVVVSEEINMYKDSPAERIYDYF